VLPLVGYSDVISAAPGDTVTFMVSAQVASYRARLVQLIHGDTNPDGPGFRQIVRDDVLDQEQVGKAEQLRPGSYGEIPLPASTSGAVTFTAFIQAWNPGDGRQTLAGRGDPETAGGWAFELTADGAVDLIIGADGPPERHRLLDHAARWQWHSIGLSVDTADGCGSAWCTPLRALDTDLTWRSIDLDRARLDVDAPLVLAARGDTASGTTAHFDGRIDAPRLADAALPESVVRLLATANPPHDRLPPLTGIWQLGIGVATDDIVDFSGNDHHGRLVHMPTRAVTGHNHSGREACFRLAPEEYGAVHFHRDDLEDAGWAPDFTLTIPADLTSGVYAAWLTAADDEDYVPFVVRPPRGAAHSRIAVLMSTLTYLSYENFTDLGKHMWKAGATFDASAQYHPFADPTLAREVYEYIDDNLLYGPYDRHVDGSGICYGSTLRPILTIRPKFRYRVLSAPTRFAADLYLVDWLDHESIAVDYITDHDLHAEGTALLDRYQVVISSAHHEYWTYQMLDGLENYLGDGGRFLYLGGDSISGVISIDPERPHKFECRRWGTSWPYEIAPAERYHSTTGEMGGTWRNRGRGAHRFLGVGTSGAGFDRGSGFGRTPAAADPRVAFAFDGLAPDELIGDCPSLQIRWGAAGIEFDRCDYELGSPAHTQLLASSVRFNASHFGLLDDQLWYADGRAGRRVDEPQVPGRAHPFVRSDITYTEYPNGGAVFAAGSIAWRSCLSAHNYRNTVATVTRNVLQRFAATPRGQAPGYVP
jgi:N,N-dimethylformamidase